MTQKNGSAARLCAVCDLPLTAPEPHRCMKCNKPICRPELRDCWQQHWETRHGARRIQDVKTGVV